MSDRASYDEHRPTAGPRTASDGTPTPVDITAEPEGRLAILVFLAGPLIWTIHFAVVYLVAEAGCTGDGAGLDVFDPPVPTVVTIVATLVAALACIASAWWGYSRWTSRMGSREEPGAEDSAGGGALLLGGSLLSLLGVAVVLFVGVPGVTLPMCG